MSFRPLHPVIGLRYAFAIVAGAASAREAGSPGCLQPAESPPLPRHRLLTNAGSTALRASRSSHIHLFRCQMSCICEEPSCLFEESSQAAGCALRAWAWAWACARARDVAARKSLPDMQKGAKPKPGALLLAKTNCVAATTVLLQLRCYCRRLVLDPTTPARRDRHGRTTSNERGADCDKRHRVETGERQAGRRCCHGRCRLGHNFAEHCNGCDRRCDRRSNCGKRGDGRRGRIRGGSRHRNASAHKCGDACHAPHDKCPSYVLHSYPPENTAPMILTCTLR